MSKYYIINFQRFGNKTEQSILREFRNLLFENKYLTDKCIALALTPCHDAEWVLLYCFTKVNVTLTHICIKWVQGDPSTIFGN